MQNALAAVQVLDELSNAARVFELQLLGFAGLGVGIAFVGERDLQAFVQESQFAQPLGQRVKVVFGDGENFFVWKKVNLGAAFLRGSRLAQLALRVALGITLLPHVAVAPDFEVQLMTESVHA